MGNLTYGVYQVLGIDVPFPSLADVGYTATYVGLLAAVLGSLHRESHRANLAIGLDAAIAACGAALVLALILKPSTDGFDLATLFTTAGYPITDLVVVALVVGKVTLCVGPDRRMWGLIGIGVLLFAVADTVYVHQILNGTYVNGMPLDTIWLVGALTMTMAVWQPQRPRDMARRAFAEQYALSLTATALGLGTLVWAAFRPLGTAAILLAALIILMVMVRTHVAVIDLARMADVREQAKTDDLTGLSNRRALFAALPSRLADRTTGRVHPAIMLLDLDGFKEVNDRYGHAAGDQILRETARRLVSSVRGDDLVARLGGDEFAVVASVDDELDACGLADRIALRIGRPLSVDGRRYVIRTSIGVVLARTDDDADSVLRRADKAMYEAKSAGGGVRIITA